MHPIEQRIFHGQSTRVDAEWLSLFSELLESVEISDLAECGMSMDAARRLVGLLALAPRLAEEAA